MKTFLFCFLACSTTVALLAVENLGQLTRPVRDPVGGASILFAHPQNPSTRRPPQTANTAGDNVDDAIALGNAARDRKPPDLASAERAYRLAWKLNPNDPRPH